MDVKKLMFSKNHIWISKENNTVKLGLTDYAQKSMKSVVFVNLPDSGDELCVDKAFGDVESLKSVSDLISPLDGTITSVNDSLVDEPDHINDSPYNAWLIEAEATRLSDELMTYDEYLAFLERE